MSRPKTKTELLSLSQENYSRLIDLIDSLPKNRLENEFPEGYLNRNVRDVIAHLHHWHLMFLKWYEVGMAGNKPAMPAEGYTWKTLPELNRKIQETYTQISLSEARALLGDSYQTLQNRIKKHSEADLFEKKKYIWTGSTSLAAYLISATSSHYDWAYKLIKKSMKASA